MADYYLGQIIQFAGNFTIQGTAMCNGALMNISQNEALFALLGVTYGGNGSTTFGLPDLRSRTMVGFGQGGGLSNYVLGQQGGTENVQLLVSNMPQHNHLINVVSGSPGTTTASGGNYLATSAISPSSVRAQALTYSTSTPDSTLGVTTVGTSGSNIPIPVLQPYLAVNFLIVTNGIFPSRN